MLYQLVLFEELGRFEMMGFLKKLTGYRKNNEEVRNDLIEIYIKKISKLKIIDSELDNIIKKCKLYTEYSCSTMDELTMFSIVKLVSNLNSVDIFGEDYKKIGNSYEQQGWKIETPNQLLLDIYSIIKVNGSILKINAERMLDFFNHCKEKISVEIERLEEIKKRY